MSEERKGHMHEHSSSSDSLSRSVNRSFLPFSPVTRGPSVLPLGCRPGARAVSRIDNKKLNECDMKSPIIPLERIQRAIYLIRQEKVMIDRDLAPLYGVTTGNLNKAVKRNVSRFPADFMFQLSPEEAQSLSFQSGSLKRSQHFKYLPYAFTEQGVAMLSSVLRSERAVQVNVAIMRAFVQLRRVLASHTELARKLAELEKKIEGHDTAIRSLFDAIRQLMAPPPPGTGREIGFHVHEQPVPYRACRKTCRVPSKAESNRVANPSL